VLKDFFNDVRLVNEADDSHLSLAFAAGERVGFVDFPDEVRPSMPVEAMRRAE
jgi:hypothetical protein